MRLMRILKIMGHSFLQLYFVLFLFPFFVSTFFYLMNKFSVKERNLPLNVITKSFEQRSMLLKRSFLILIALGLILLFVNHYFPFNYYEVLKNSAYVRPLRLNRSFNSVPFNQTRQEEVVGHVIMTESAFKYNSTSMTALPSPINNKSELWLDYCNLTNIDPWDSTIIEFFHPQKDHMLGCAPEIFQHSKLIDGQLFIYFKETLMEMNCQMRCLFPKNEWEITFGDWINVINGTRPECDVIEVKCNENDYKFLHAQIYRNISKFPPPTLLSSKPPEKYDVHVIIWDSVSYTQFIRSMPKTSHVLREDFEAIPFRHLNKVGVRSVQNGFAFLFGKTINSILKSLVSRGHLNDFSGKNEDEICRIPLDNEQFIGFRYQDDGYVTMMAEDWNFGLANYPNCTGFTKTPLDHYMKPFQLQEFTPTYEKIMRKKSCHEDHQYLFNYLKDFLKAYPDKPKFSISWMIHLAHNEPNGLSSSDDFFYRFFSDTKKDFENSFLFIMGDHGLRFSKIRETKIGEMEDNNPALFISVPKPLRDNATLMNQLRKNSKELITHYDIYATLNKIAQPKNPRIPNPILHGSSLFHPLPYPRTCDSLRIPFEYCICHSTRTLLPKNNSIGIPASKLMVEQINFDLSTSVQTSEICAKLILKKSADVVVEDYGSQNNVHVYKITFSTLPGNGKFWGFVSYDSSNNKFDTVSSKAERLNSYAKQTKCIHQSPIISYCYCIDQFASVDKSYNV